MTPTQRDNIPAKSPVSGGDPVASHSPFDPHHRSVVPGDVVYRAHLPPHLDPALAFHRVLDPGVLPEPSPTPPTHTTTIMHLILSVIHRQRAARISFRH